MIMEYLYFFYKNRKIIIYIPVAKKIGEEIK